MAYSVDPLVYERFKGIREYNGVNSNGELSAIEANNVELVQSEIGSNVGIKSMKGNIVSYTLPEGYEIKGIWESIQDSISYKFIYAETNTKGSLFYINIADIPEILVDNLTVTGECSALTMNSTAYDVFVFTNGKEAKTVCFTSDVGYGDKVKTINATDYLGRNIHWLSMTAWNGFLVVASEYGVHSSHQNDIYTWNENPQDTADAWYIDFNKKVTAVYGFTGGLYIFTEDDCTLLNTTPNDTANAVMTTASGVGCYSYSSIVKHDLYLFFYDNRQKNIYYLSATDTTGQIKPTGPVAKEIQSYFNHIDKFKMFSCIYSNRNEVWCIINENIIIFDYAQDEWLTRQEQNIETVALIRNKVYTGGNLGKVYIENYNNDFNGEYYPSVFRSTYINYNSNSNLKKEKTPLLIVVNDDYVNDFYVQLTVNGKDKNPKHVRVPSVGSAMWAIEDDPEHIATEVEYWDSMAWVAENKYSKKVIEVSTPQTWYTMGVKIFTKDKGQAFNIYSLEFKNLKIKTKTKGR